MCRLTKHEKEILDKLLVTDLSLASQELGLKPSTIYVTRARIRGKIEETKDFLKAVKKYRKVLGSSHRGIDF